MDRVQANVEKIKTQIAPYNPTIVAVTKYFDESQILKYYEIGFRDFGENRVDAFLKKYDDLKSNNEALIKLLKLAYNNSNKFSEVVL